MLIKRFMYTLFLAAVSVIAVPTLRAQTQPVCSNATLNGRYVFEADGKRIALNLLGLVTLEQSVETEGFVTLDGNGNVTSSNIAIQVDGQNSINKDSGSYTVNADCSGTLTLNDPNEPLTFSIEAQGFRPNNPYR